MEEINHSGGSKMSFENKINTKTYKSIKFGFEKYNFQTKIQNDEIKTILSITTNPTIKSHENLSGLINLSGLAKIDIVYLDTNDTIHSLSQISEFNTSVENKNAEQFFFNCFEQETSASLLANNEVLISSVFCIEINGIISTEINAPSTGNAEIFEQIKTIDVQSLSAISDDRIIVSDESEIAATGIVKTEANCVVTKVTPAEDMLTVDGELLVSICSEIDGNLKTTFKRIEFSSEVSALGAKPSNIANYFANVETYTATITNEGTNAVLNITATIKFGAFLFQNNQIQLIEDAYSTTKELILSTSGFENQLFLHKNKEEHDLTVNLTTKDKTVNMGSILAVLSPIYSFKEKVSTIECTVIYKHAETDKIESIILSGTVPTFENIPSIILKSFTKKKAKEIEIDIAVITENIEEATNYETYITEIEEGSAFEVDNKAIIVYQALAGQTLFSVSKALKTSPDTLKSQNAELEDVFTYDRKVVLYKKATPLFQ